MDMAIVPVVAPVGTVKVICEVLLTVKLASTPPTVTVEIPVKLVPVTITSEPILPLAGEKAVIVGAADTVNEAPLVAVPPVVLMVILPVVAPAGTTATICVADIGT